MKWILALFVFLFAFVACMTSDTFEKVFAGIAAAAGLLCFIAMAFTGRSNKDDVEAEVRLN